MRSLFILISILSLSLAVAEEVEAYAPDIFAVCGLDPNGDNFLALRAGPGSRYQMLARLGPGTVVMDWDRKGKWYLVTVGDVHGMEGWVYAPYLCLIEDH